MNTHIASRKVWLKSVLPWLKYSIFPRDYSYWRTLYIRGLFLLWRRCDTLCTSGFVDDVMLAVWHVMCSGDRTREV